MKKLMVLLLTLINMASCSPTSTNSFVQDVLKNPNNRSYVFHTSYPYKKALSRNPDDGSNGIIQEERIMSNKGTLEKVFYKFRMCGKKIDKSPYEIGFPETGEWYFRRSSEDDWQKALYSPKDSAAKYFPGCGK